jgi:hypothetical protein
MYGLPDDFDPSAFVGCEFETLTFASNAILLAFGEDISVTIVHHLRYRLERETDIREDVLPVTESGLPALIGQSVERAEVRRPGDLLLHFYGGGLLLVQDHDEHYESYSVRTPAGEVFV